MNEQITASNEVRVLPPPFWLVWCDTGFAPKFKHSTIESAEKEAERLARENPGRNFYVVMPICEMKKADVTVQHFTYEKDELPF